MNVFRKYVPIVVIFLLALPVSAQTTLTDAQKDALIQTLLAQVKVLQTKLAELIAARGEGMSCDIQRTLTIGSRGDDVSCLQRYLKQTGDFTHPEITGYFGPVTESAVKKYQTRQGIVSGGPPATTGYGVVGPRTRAALSVRIGGGGGGVPVPPGPPISPPGGGGGGGGGGGNTPPSMSVFLRDDTTPPFVTLTAPDDGTVVSGPWVLLEAVATDNIDVASVEFMVGNVSKGKDTSSPYSYGWNTLSETNGAKTLSVVAIDGAGNRATSTRNVTVQNTTIDTTSPTVALTSPDATSVSGPWVIVAATSTDNIGVVAVEFKYKLDGSLAEVPLGIDTTASAGNEYSVMWDTTSLPLLGTTSTIYAVTHDAAGNRATSTKRVDINGNYLPVGYGNTQIRAQTQFVRPANGVKTFVYAGTSYRSSIMNYMPFITKQVDYIIFPQGVFTTPRKADDFDGTYTHEDLYAMIRTIKAADAADPSLKIAVYGGHGTHVAPWQIPYPAMEPNNFLHSAVDGKVQIWSGQTGKKLEKGEKFLNIGTPAARQDIVNFWATTLQQNPDIDSLLFDGYVNPFADPGLQDGCQEGLCKTTAYWDAAMTAFSTALQAVVPGDVIYNGINATCDNPVNRPPGTCKGDPDINLNEGWIEWNDGALAEQGLEIRLSPEKFDRYMRAITKITDQNKKVFFLVQHFHDYAPAADWNIDLTMEQFYLASYLLFQKNPLTYLQYNPGANFRINHGLYYYENWNYDYGTPTRVYQKHQSGLYERRYTNGIAVVNPTATTLTYTFPGGAQYRVWHPSTGPIVSGSVAIPAKTGVFYFRQ